MAFMPSSDACTLLVRMMQPSGVHGGIAADQHHREPGCYPVLALHPRDLTGDAGAKFGGNNFSIDDPGRHLNPFVDPFVDPSTRVASGRFSQRLAELCGIAVNRDLLE